MPKVPSTKFHGNPSSESRADTFGQKDGYEEANDVFRGCADVCECKSPRYHFLLVVDGK